MQLYVPYQALQTKNVLELTAETLTSHLRWEELLGRRYNPILTALVFRKALEMSHDGAIDFIKRARPRGQEYSFEGSSFWKNWDYRATLIMGLLSRTGTVEHYAAEELDLPDSKIYVFLREWLVAFKCLSPAPRIEEVEGLNGDLEGSLTWDGTRYRLKTTTRTYTVVWHPWGRTTKNDKKELGSWTAIDDPGEDVSTSVVPHAASYAATQGFNLLHYVSTDQLLAELDVYSRIVHKQPTLSIGKDKLIPKQVLVDLFGLQATERACAALNKCGCIFWDDGVGSCGLYEGQNEPCEDFAALEVA